MRLSFPGTAFVAALAATVSVALAQAQTGTAPDVFTPVPCAPQTWEYSDPTFTALPGARAFAGRYEGGLYRIEVPDDWNGELVLFAHGFIDSEGGQGSTLRVPNTAGPLREHAVSRGFAWAASSYRCNGYVPGVGLIDTMALTGVVSKMIGKPPVTVWLIGASMGGHTTILGLHEFPTAFAGGLAMCPAGPDTMDFLTAVGAAAEALVGMPFGDGDVPLDVARIARELGSPQAYTVKGRQLASATIHLSGGPRPFALEGLAARFAANIRDGVRLRRFEPWNRAATNAEVTYIVDPGLGVSSDALDTSVDRRAFDPVLRGGAGAYDEVAAFDGRIERPLLTLHGTGDLYVPISVQRSLKRAVDRAEKSRLLVQRIMRIPGHCGFSSQEQIAAFDDLVRWAKDGVRPDGDDVFADLRDAGRRFTNPLRPGDPGTVGVVVEPAGGTVPRR